MSPIVKTNIYRCIEYCPNCPFKDNGKAIHLDPNRIPELTKYLLETTDSSFNCHKTVYDLDNEMNPSDCQTIKMCYGAWLLKRKHKIYNTQMKLAIALGIDNPPEKEPDNGLYEI